MVDLQGRSKALAPRWPRVLGLAWSPDGSEVLFTAGRIAATSYSPSPGKGTTRELYASPADLRLEDVAPDGTVLATEQLERTELGLSSTARAEQSTLTWGNWANFVARVSDEGNVLFSESVPVAPEKGEMPTQPVWTLLRRSDRDAAQILGPGSPQDLSPDGRSALVAMQDRRMLTALPIGPGQGRPVQTHGMEVGACPVVPGRQAPARDLPGSIG